MAAKQNLGAIKLISPKLMQNEDFIIELVRQNGLALKFLKPDIQQNTNIVKIINQ
jgi:hypothetical protein